MGTTSVKRQGLKLLVVAAYGPELQPWVKLGRKHFLIKDGIAFLQAGIGPVAASFGLTHFLEDFAPQRIMAIGTAGTFDVKRFPLGSLVVARHVSTRSHLSGVDACGPKAITLKPTKNKSLNVVRVFAPQEITIDAQRARQLARRHDIEHLESYAYAFVARKFRIPLQIFLGVTNAVGPLGHAQWRQNEAGVIKKLHDFTRKGPRFCP